MQSGTASVDWVELLRFAPASALEAGKMMLKLRHKVAPMVETKRKFLRILSSFSDCSRSVGIVSETWANLSTIESSIEIRVSHELKMDDSVDVLPSATSWLVFAPMITWSELCSSSYFVSRTRVLSATHRPISWHRFTRRIRCRHRFLHCHVFEFALCRGLGLPLCNT